MTSSELARHKSYREYINDTEDARLLYTFLSTLQEPTFRIKPEREIAAYFQTKNLPYETDNDIDVLSRLLADEISQREGNDRMQKLVEMNIGRRSLERMIGQNVKTYAVSLEELGTLEEPLQQLGETLYDTLRAQGEGITYVPQNCLPPEEEIYGHLFYKVEKEKVIFGLCGPEKGDPHWNEWKFQNIQGVGVVGWYGFHVVLEKKHPKKGFFKKEDKSAPAELNVTIVTPHVHGYRPPHMSSYSILSFLDCIKNEVRSAKSIGKIHTKYLKMITSFPYLLDQGLWARKQEIEESVGDVLSNQSRMKSGLAIVPLDEE